MLQRQQGVGVEAVGRGVFLDAGDPLDVASLARQVWFDGRELFALAKKHNSAISFEASCGGGIPIIGALLRGLTTVISHATGLDVRLAEDPLTCVARGTSVYLENLELWKDTMESDADDQ